MGERCAQVFFACLYDHQVQLSATLARMLRRPWTGLYLQAIAFHQPGRKVPRLQRNFPIQRLFAVPRMTGLLMLDEGMADKVARATGRRVVIAPDVADGPWLTEHPLAMQCRQRAGAAPLVGLLGHLLPSKGITTLAEIALRDDAQDLAYLFAGEIYWTMFKPAQKEIIERAMHSARTAIFIAQRVPDSAAFNALVAVCDVLFAAYHDFPHSSNMLTLGRLPRKADRRERRPPHGAARAGLSVGRGGAASDPAAALEALRRVARDPAAWRAARQPRWREYRERHSAAALDGALRELFAIRRRRLSRFSADPERTQPQREFAQAAAWRAADGPAVAVPDLRVSSIVRRTAQLRPEQVQQRLPAHAEAGGEHFEQAQPVRVVEAFGRVGAGLGKGVRAVNAIADGRHRVVVGDGAGEAGAVEQAIVGARAPVGVEAAVEIRGPGWPGRGASRGWT